MLYDILSTIIIIWTIKPGFILKLHHIKSSKIFENLGISKKIEENQIKKIEENRRKSKKIEKNLENIFSDLKR